MRRLLGLVSVFAVVLVPVVAHADEDEPPLHLQPAQGTPTQPPAATESTTATVDTVHLRNGGLFRGRVTEIVPGDHVTVILPSNETKRVPWPEVDRVIVASTPIPPPATAATPAAAPPMVGPKARVHITSPKRAILYRRPAGTNSWVQACESPCDVELPIGDTYRIAGSGLSQSKELHLEAGPGGFVDLVVDPPSTGGMIAGGILAGAGGLAGSVGALMALVGASDAGRDCSRYYDGGYYFYSKQQCERDKANGPALRDAGLVTLGVGAAVGVVGLVVFLNSTKTDIDQRGHAREAKLDRPVDAFLRQPSWKSVASSAESATPAPAASFPFVLTGHF